MLRQGQDRTAGSLDPEDDSALPTLRCFPGMELRYPSDRQHIGKVPHQHFNFPSVIPRGASTHESAYL